MAEVILPGTYIAVRDEGLISAGGVITGNIGLVGTAAEGPTDEMVICGSFTEARAVFGDAGGWDAANVANNHTLMRALELIYNNGGRTVYAVRTKDTGTADYVDALAVLENEIVNIVVLAGQDNSTATGMAAALQAHLNTTAGIKRERIGIIGCSTDDVDDVADHTLNSDRMIFAAPGVRTAVSDPNTRETAIVDLPGGYMAAVVAGRIASLPVQSSPTNKPLTVAGLTTNYSSAQLEKLIQNRVFAAERREGYRVVKGITTATNSAWHQITTRRIVDYAIYGVRSSCNPYIGKLNNDRVRSAMKATLDAFLTRMYDDEALVGYELEVSATRAQEIAGEAIVTMTLQPTFSIDFIKVTMYLG